MPYLMHRHMNQVECGRSLCVTNLPLLGAIKSNITSDDRRIDVGREVRLCQRTVGAIDVPKGEVQRSG